MFVVTLNIPDSDWIILYKVIFNLIIIKLVRQMTKNRSQQLCILFDNGFILSSSSWVAIRLKVDLIRHMLVSALSKQLIKTTIEITDLSNLVVSLTVCHILI